MYCTKCGYQIEDDAKFCEHCGEPVTVITPEMMQDTNTSDSDKNKSPINRGILTALILILALISWFLFSPHPLIVRFLDSALKNNTYTENSSEVSEKDAADEKTKALENGDDITGEDSTPKEIQKADPFEDIKFDFDPASGKAVVTPPESGPFSDVEYIVENNFALKEGDSVNVRLTDYHNGDIKEFFLEHYGIELTCTEKTFTCTSDGNDVSANVSVPEENIQGENSPTEEVSEYILPDSDAKYLSDADLSGFDADMCRKARNEIFARHGRKFNDTALQEYFNSKSWYTPTTEPDAFSESVLNEYEKANKDFIASYEAKMGFR